MAGRGVLRCVLAMICSCDGDGEWDARAALPGGFRPVGWVVSCGVCAWWFRGLAGWRWNGWVSGCGFAGMACDVFGRWQADEPESLILAQSERWRHA